MSDADLKEKEESAALDDTAADFSPEEQAEFDKLAENDDQVGEGYKQDTKPKRKGRFSRRQKGIGGAIGGLILGTGIAGLLIMTPVLKLESFMNRINNRVMSVAETAVEKRLGHLMETYMARHVLSLRNCGNTVTIDCSVATGGVAKRLFGTWRDARIEEKLFDRFGIQIETSRNPDPSTGQHRVVLRDRFGKQINLNDGELRAGRFTGGDREFGRQLRLYVKQETKWWQVMQRKSIRKYATNKHGAKWWCFLACKERDNFDAKVSTAKTKLKYKFVERFVYPFSGKYGLIFDCITRGSTGGRCSGESLRERGIDRNRVSDDVVKEITDTIDKNPNARITTFIIDKLVAKIFGQQAAKATISAIPVAGQIYLAVTIADIVDRMDQFVDDNGFSKYAANVNAAQYIEYYQGMRSANDELKSHNLSFADVAALTTEFDGGEKSLVYQENYAKGATPLASLFGGTAYAQSATPDEDYTCVNGKPIPKNELVCEEKKVTRRYAVEELRDNVIVDKSVDLLNRYGECLGSEIFGRCPQGEPKKYIRPVLDAINMAADTVLGPVVDGLMWTAEHTPGVGSFIDYAKGLASDFAYWFLEKVFPLPLYPDSPGRDKVDGLQAGGELMARGFGQGGVDSGGNSYGLGASKITSEQVSAILRDKQEQDDFNHKNGSLYDKVASLDNPSSVANNFLLQIPINDGTMSGVASGLLGSIFNIFGIFSNFGSSPAHAATTDSNPFGITRYGYPIDSSVYDANPDIYTDEYCAETRKAWEASKTEDPITGFEEYSVADPCMLERIAAEAGGAYFTND